MYYYDQAPMTLLRTHAWLALRGHPGVTFLATDVDEAVLPYLDPPPGHLRQHCPKCGWGCKRCIHLPEGIRLDTSLGRAPRVGLSGGPRSLGRRI